MGREADVERRGVEGGVRALPRTIAHRRRSPMGTADPSEEDTPAGLVVLAQEQNFHGAQYAYEELALVAGPAAQDSSQEVRYIQSPVRPKSFPC